MKVRFPMLDSVLSGAATPVLVLLTVIALIAAVVVLSVCSVATVFFRLVRRVWLALTVTKSVMPGSRVSSKEMNGSRSAAGRVGPRNVSYRSMASMT